MDQNYILMDIQLETIDPSIQRKAEKALIEGLENLDQRQGWRGR